MSISDYQFPVSELLNYGDCRNYKEWPNYVQELNNGLLIGILVDLQAVETIPIMEQAFQANQVDTFLVGDWEDIQVELGLKNREEVPERQFPEPSILASLFSSSRPTKVSKGFGSPQSEPTQKKSRKSSSKRKKS
jgi:hypothetical protein